MCSCIQTPGTVQNAFILWASILMYHKYFFIIINEFFFLILFVKFWFVCLFVCFLFLLTFISGDNTELPTMFKWWKKGQVKKNVKYKLC